MSKRKVAPRTKPKRSNAAKGHRGRNQRTKSGSATKTQLCVDLLSRAGGVTLEEMQKATGWQPHSVRGFLSGTVKKMAGLRLSSEKPGEGPRRYRVQHLSDRTS